MRILFLTRYGRLGASSRYRILQYLPWFERAGFDCNVSSLFDDSYLRYFYRTKTRRLTDVVRAILRRIVVLTRSARYDLIVIEKELIPYFPAWIETFLERLGIPYVVDYDDAIFHLYDEHSNPLVRLIFRNKIANVMRHAALVVAGNQYISDYATSVGATRVEIIPTVIDLNRYTAQKKDFAGRQSSRVFTIGWIGTPATAKYLHVIAPALKSVCAEGAARLRLIGAGTVDIADVPVEVMEWREDREVQDLSTFDVGIMPLPDEPWERGKCGFKLIQYMASGLPVIASPVGVNVDIVQSGRNGFLCKTNDEWATAFRLLMNSAELCVQMGRVGRRMVEEKYCIQVQYKKLIKIFIESQKLAI